MGTLIIPINPLRELLSFIFHHPVYNDNFIDARPHRNAWQSISHLIGNYIIALQFRRKRYVECNKGWSSKGSLLSRDECNKKVKQKLSNPYDIFSFFIKCLWVKLLCSVPIKAIDQPAHVTGIYISLFLQNNFLKLRNIF